MMSLEGNLHGNGGCKHAERFPAPEGKDPTEDFQRGVSLRKWITWGINK